ncbi:hypothetical protein ABRY95_00060 [Castellaniella ginsengisoli]|uniref:Uncharacterized protein n=1 Tax=Castellaniella ginsengisoli TaxID=546114 RepID=A0AB39GR82_9BURK
MSIRTIIEINHDHLTPATCASLCSLVSQLGLSEITAELNRQGGAPINLSAGVRILAQRHHSTALKLEVQ